MPNTSKPQDKSQSPRINSLSFTQTLSVNPKHHQIYHCCQTTNQNVKTKLFIFNRFVTQILKCEYTYETICVRPNAIAVECILTMIKKKLTIT